MTIEDAPLPCRPRRNVDRTEANVAPLPFDLHPQQAGLGTSRLDEKVQPMAIGVPAGLRVLHCEGSKFCQIAPYPFRRCGAIRSERQRTVTEHTFLTCFDLGGKNELQRTVANS